MSARLETLAKQIADVSVRSEVELYAKSVLDNSGHPCYLLPLRQNTDADANRVRDAVQYIEMRGPWAFSWVMHRSGEVVWFEDNDVEPTGIEATVRFSSGTYLARSGGKRASSTQSDQFALEALARKLGMKSAVIFKSVTNVDGSISCLLREGV